MADEADIAGDYIEKQMAQTVAATRADIDPGKPGECDICGEFSGRLIAGVCAPCRELEEARKKRMIGRY